MCLLYPAPKENGTVHVYVQVLAWHGGLHSRRGDVQPDDDSAIGNPPAYAADNIDILRSCAWTASRSGLATSLDVWDVSSRALCLLSWLDNVSFPCIVPV